MYIKPAREQKPGGFALAQALVACAVIGILVMALVSFSMFSTRSFASLFNYCDLDMANKTAIDQLTRDVRQANKVKEATATRLVLEDSDGEDLTYEYFASTRTFKRTKNGVARTVLTECDRLTFDLGQRNIVGGSYDYYPVATTIDTAKIINVSWVCSRSLLAGRKENTESVQTARIVIRKQQPGST